VSAAAAAPGDPAGPAPRAVGRPGLGDPSLLLAAWDAASAAPDVAKGCAVLAAAEVIDRDAAFDLPLGLLGELALRCHIEMNGVELDGMAACPACLSGLEISLALDALLPAAGPNPPPTRDVVLTGRRVTARAPTVRDLLAAAAASDPRSVIVGRCVREAGGAPVDVSGLDDADLEPLDAALEDLTGAGLATLRAACPGCGAEVVSVLDPGALLWDRVRLAAPALLRDVAVLARAFGWRESDVLALPPSRRRAYLELAGR